MDELQINSLVESRVKEVIKEAHGSLLKEISGMMNKISAPSSSSSSASLSVMEAPKFKRRSNEEQFKHNAKVITKLDQAESNIDSEMTIQARENIIEAREMMKKRQKLIQLADTSELGWKVVDEYETNPIASDSEDEKRIYRAEARASRKAKTEKSKRGRGKPYRRYPAREESTSVVGQSSVTAGTGTGRRPGLCFTCGGAGHWKNECPKTSSNKISSLYCSVKGGECPNPGLDVETDFSEQVIKNIAVKEIDNGKESTVVSPVGRLKACVSKWSKTTDSSYILDVIRNGYKLPFYSLPEKVCLRNNKSARDNPDFVSQEISVLLRKGVVSAMSEKPEVINPLTVAYGKSGKPRLVLDCRHINPCLHLFKVKFKDVKVAEGIFQPFSYVFTFDLKSAYHHIDIATCHRTFLGFSWCTDGKEKYYVYNSLPFGIATAGHIFTKVLRVLIAHWRFLGISIVAVFLDDGMGGNVDLDVANRHSRYVRQFLLDMGFLLAEDKCDWVPKRYASWLGHMFCFAENRLRVSVGRIDRLEMHIDSVLFEIQRDGCQITHVKTLASVIGQIISLQTVLGKHVSLRTRNLYNCLLARISWNCSIRVSGAAIGELQYWRKNARALNDSGRALWGKQVIDAVVFCDASSEGYGGYVEAATECRSDIEVKGSNETLSAKGVHEVISNEESGDQVCSVCSSVVVDEQSSSNVQLSEASCNRLVEWNATDYSERGHDDLEFTRLPEVSSAGRKLDTFSPSEGLGLTCELPEMSSSHSGFVQDRLSTDYAVNYHGNSVHPQGIYSDRCDLCCVSNSQVSHKEMERAQDLSGTSRPIVENSQVFGSWTQTETEKSSTWRELEAVRRVVLSNVHILKSSHVQVFSDNQNVERILQAGSKVEELQALSLKISRLCEINDIHLVPKWIPRSMNMLADHLSRCKDSDDWYISRELFRMLDLKWGPHTVDRFATHYNAQCKRFNSRWWVPGTEAVDCFDQCWKGIGIETSLKRKIDDTGVYIENRDEIVSKMARQLLTARADSTNTKYYSQWKAFESFCDSKNIPCRPVSSIHVAMYISSLIETGKSDKVISASIYAIKWFHRTNDYLDPTDNRIVTMILESAKRTNSKPVVKKDVINVNHLIELCSIFGNSNDVIVLRDLSMILLDFAGFLRFNEIVQLKCSDVEFKTNHIVLHIRSSKTDVYRAGKEVLIAKGSTCACPVDMLSRYLQQSKLLLRSDSYLFKPACRSGSKCFLLKQNKKLSYTRSRECIVSRLKLVAPDLRLGTHSLRANGVTSVANAGGVSERRLKRHGRWKTDICKEGYIDDSVEKCLAVTRQLKM